MKVLEIKTENEVSDFSNYSYLENLNRGVDKLHVKKLADSFTKFGTAAAKVIVIRTKVFGILSHYVVDGQHTIAASKLSGIPIETVTIVAMVDETLEKVTQYMAVLNNVKKGWSTKNYLKAFVGNDKHEYIVFDNLVKEHKLTVTDLMHIFLGASDHKLFKEGTMKFKAEKDSLNLVAAFVKIREHLPKKAFCTRNLPKVMRTDGNRNYKPFVDAVIRGAKVGFQFSENEKEFVSEIRDIMRMINIKVA